MFTINAIKNMVKNVLENEKNFSKNGDTFTVYNGKNEKLNVHLTIAQVQIFKNSDHIKSIKIEPKKEFKEAEKQVREIMKFIKEYTK